jgi:hypothetical protein
MRIAKNVVAQLRNRQFKCKICDGDLRNTGTMQCALEHDKYQTKKYNDQSKQIADWTTKKLKEEAKVYYHGIYVLECFGTRDAIAYDVICRELSFRGVEPKTKLYF